MHRLRYARRLEGRQDFLILCHAVCQHLGDPHHSAYCDVTQSHVDNNRPTCHTSRSILPNRAPSALSDAASEPTLQLTSRKPHLSSSGVVPKTSHAFLKRQDTRFSFPTARRCGPDVLPHFHRTASRSSLTARADVRGQRACVKPDAAGTCRSREQCHPLTNDLV